MLHKDVVASGLMSNPTTSLICNNHTNTPTLFINKQIISIQHLNSDLVLFLGEIKQKKYIITVLFIRELQADLFCSPSLGAKYIYNIYGF